MWRQRGWRSEQGSGGGGAAAGPGPGPSTPTGTGVNNTGALLPEGAIVAPTALAGAALLGALEVQAADAVAAAAVQARAIAVVSEAGGISSGGGTGAIAFNGPTSILLVTGLTLVDGDDLYLSSVTPGRATNVAPAAPAGVAVFKVATLVGKLSYTGAAEGLVHGVFFPAQKTVVA